LDSCIEREDLNHPQVGLGETRRKGDKETRKKGKKGEKD